MRVAIVQKPPVLLDREASLAVAVAAGHDAAQSGAQLVVFPETFLPGYPVWIWRLRPGPDAGLTARIHAQLLANAIDLSGNDLAPLQKAALQHNVAIVCGINERDHNFSRGTLYNTVVLIGPDGAILNRHRKLMPTNPERMVWGIGDATGLNVVETPVGRVGTLICWENYMPLSRYALYAQGVEIYVAPTYDSGERWLASMQHIAREGGCWVLGSGFAMRGRDIPDAFPGKNQLFPDQDEWINPGDSVIVAPSGKIVAGPLRQEFGMLTAEIDLAECGAARRTLDTAGHYARPDIFQLHIDRRPLKPVAFDS